MNTFKVDYAANDCRSVSSMLRGNGDGRERRWQKYAPMINEAVERGDNKTANALSSKMAGDATNTGGLLEALRALFKVAGNGSVVSRVLAIIMMSLAALIVF